MAFQILDSNNKAIAISELDAQAAQFWNKEVHPKHYASPYTMEEGLGIKEQMDFHMKDRNWFDAIGWFIHDGAKDWQAVEIAIMNANLIEKYGLDVMVEIYKPYILLVRHWESLGYKPLPVSE